MDNGVVAAIGRVRTRSRAHAALIERIAELVNDKKLEGIADIRDESDRDGMRIVIELRRDALRREIRGSRAKL